MCANIQPMNGVRYRSDLSMKDYKLHFHMSKIHHKLHFGSPKTILSASMEVIHASEWIGTPNSFNASRPPSKDFSIKAPMPTIFEPEASASRANPSMVCPLARKSSMINTFSPLARYSGETINSTMRPFVWEGARVK